MYCKTAALQVADIFTKQLFPKHFERLRMVLLGHENWDDMVQRVESVTTAGDDIDDPKLYASGDSAPRGQGGHPKLQPLSPSVPANVVSWYSKPTASSGRLQGYRFPFLAVG